jgi:hypothetical protein
MLKAAWILAVLVLVGTGALGLVNAMQEWRDNVSALQYSVTAGVALYGVLGLVGGAGLARRRVWSVPVTTAWAAVVTYVATVASFAYSDPTFTHPGTTAGVIGAFVGSALIGALIVWIARRSTRAAAAAARAPSPESRATK